MRKKKKMNNYQHISGSFRDPSGFLFKYNDEVFRQINLIYKEDYDLLMNSGLYDELVKKNWLISHKEIELDNNNFSEEAYKIIKPEQLKFISYPYEYSFSQLKDAALLTLKILKKALKFGMILKDASIYNIQFHKGKPIFIDTLSFEKYDGESPWVAYKQFCQHFLAPLALMTYKDIRLSTMLNHYIDGIPLDLTAKLLPCKTYFKFSLLLHIHIHSLSQNRYSDKPVKEKIKKRKFSKLSFLGLIDGLETAVKKLKLKKLKTEWADYYSDNSYTDKDIEEKKNIVSEMLKTSSPEMVWDFGANTGFFSRISSEKNIPTISFDIDPICIENSYLYSKNNNEKNIVPLLLDLTNPPSGLGWANEERMSLIERGPVDLLLALALIHHLAISNNVPFDMIAEYFSKLCKNLIIEFVPKNDVQVQRLLKTRKDIFVNYNEENFVKSFTKYFEIIESKTVGETGRSIYFFKNINKK